MPASRILRRYHVCGIRPQIQQDGWVPEVLPIFSAGWATPLAGVAAAARTHLFERGGPGSRMHVSLTLVFTNNEPYRGR
ncbi:hypothetical protein CKAH01_16359 [Colletotrichum kahawae]|uniref:Uncharacterized protein n=1 Tax=Colletotrichum kahawae TaxID=34407 RepID=A0AAD9YHQ7_COLKA|nr:hypothetical protein CKAH01_16359 [Colletotrichum kahawae]